LPGGPDRGVRRNLDCRQRVRLGTMTMLCGLAHSYVQLARGAPWEWRSRSRIESGLTFDESPTSIRWGVAALHWEVQCAA